MRQPQNVLTLAAMGVKSMSGRLAALNIAIADGSLLVAYYDTHAVDRRT
jgi:hypothetical protein